MWRGVTQRFSKFYENITLTSGQLDDGKIKHAGVRKCLNSHYYNLASESENSFLVGSWAKYTRVRPPRDIDLCFVLPAETYQRFQSYTGNKQSALLQEVKGILENTYSDTDMSGDGQVVIVKFSTISIEVVPAFKLTNGRYWICDTNNGGSYIETDPISEAALINTVHSAYNNNLRPIIKMLKVWQIQCGVPLKSFYLELLAVEFLRNCEWRQNGYFYYDWIFRDFFNYLLSKENGYIIVPGTNEAIFLGDDWKSRCDNAYNRALKACEFEHEDFINLAGEQWQKIFGTQIPQDPLL